MFHIFLASGICFPSSTVPALEILLLGSVVGLPLTFSSVMISGVICFRNLRGFLLCFYASNYFCLMIIYLFDLSRANKVLSTVKDKLKCSPGLAMFTEVVRVDDVQCFIEQELWGRQNARLSEDQNNAFL